MERDVVTVAELEAQKEAAKRASAFAAAIKRLESNRDFKLVFLDGFFRDEAARMVAVSVDYALGDRERADALGMAQASGYVQNWMEKRKMIGEKAAADIPGIDESIEEARAEQQGE